MSSNLKVREDASESILTVLMWSVFSLLGIRLYLKLMGYPEIGRGVWHVSHAASGGAIMIIGVMLLLVFSGKKIKNLSLMIYGVGQGLFIDEIGKFLSRDYNYFFQPAIIFIYVFFVGMFLVYKFLSKLETRSETKFTKMAGRISSASYNRIFKRKLVVIGLWGYSIYYAIDKLRDILMITTSSQKMMMIERYYRDYDFFGKSDVYMIVGKMVFDVMASVLFLLGARYFWSKKRLRGIRFFKYGLYVSILLGSIFRFYFEQFGAIVELVLGIVILEMLNQYRKTLTLPFPLTGQGLKRV